MVDKTKAWMAVAAVFIAITIILGSLLGMIYSQYSNLNQQLNSSKEALKSLEEKYNNLTVAIKQYENSFTKIAVPIYNSTGKIVGYKVVYVPTKTLRVGNLTLSGVKGLIEVHVYLQVWNHPGHWYTAYVVNGSSALAATLAVAKVKYTMGKWGAFVEAINGLKGNWYGNKTWWSFWVWSPKEHKWELAKVTASQYILHNGDSIAWVYTKNWPPENKPIETPTS